MTATELIRILKKMDCGKIRQKGSHARWQCGAFPMHKGDELGRGLLAAIEADLEP